MTSPFPFDDETLELAYAEALALALEDPCPGSRMAMEFALLSGEDDPDAFDPREGGRWESFSRWAASELEARLHEEAARIADMTAVLGDGRLQVWRALCVDDGWLDSGIAERPIGVCWSWDREHAIAHNGEGLGGPDRVLVRLRAAVPSEGVDWVTTLAINASSDYTVGEEREIRLLPECPVEVTGAETAAAGGPYREAAFLAADLRAGIEPAAPAPAPA